jgi:hypothetical protein
MEPMVQACSTPMQIIHAFPRGSSESLGIEKDFGTLAKGNAADPFARPSAVGRTLRMSDVFFAFGLSFWLGHLRLLSVLNLIPRINGR